MLWRLFERLFVICLLLCCMEVASGLSRPNLSESDPDLISTQPHLAMVVTDAGVYAWGGILILSRWRRMVGAVRKVWPLVGLAALAPLSIAWSAQPMLTLQRSALFFGTALVSVYLGDRYTTDQMAHLLAQAMCFMIAVVVALRFVAPEYVIDYYTHFGAWKGLSEHKNLFAQYMAIAVILLLLIRFRRFPWLRYVFLLGAMVLLVLSHGASAMLCCTLVVGSLLLWHLFRGNGRLRLLAYTIPVFTLMPLLYILIYQPQWILQVLGRDPSLTGRTKLWAAVLPELMNHPILGYGYDGFWAGFKGESLQVMLQSGWLIGAAHNGFLELLLGLGVTGMAVFACVYVGSVQKAINYLKSEAGSLGLWPIGYLTFFLLYNNSESVLLTRRSLPFLLFATITTSLALRRRRVPSPQPDSESAKADALAAYVTHDDVRSSLPYPSLGR